MISKGSYLDYGSKLQAVVAILKERFPNLTSNEVIDLAVRILDKVYPQND